MYLRKAMSQADGIRPNAVDEELKAQWLRDLDAKVAETMQVDEPEWKWPEDQELLMPHPMDRVYVFWLCAMIDWAQLDMQLYQIDKAMYDEAWSEALAWWRRHNRPRVFGKGWRVEP